ncbi:MAG TPA: SRPBCC domain-containing protein [Chitinophagales bacterium]|nr:SRPBCC domain-containing protein [Chitinophagales bacterium]
MEKKNYTTTIEVAKSPKDVFNCITAVSKWWTESVEGNSQKLNDVFTVRFGETFVTHKIVEMIPAKKVVWLVTDCNLHWINNKKEWKDTKMVFEISQKENSTQINFTHVGIVPGIECYNDCSKGWDSYIKESLFKLISEGKGITFEDKQKSSK